jgi:hypothetical protein
VRSNATLRFWAAYRELPPEIRDLAQKAYRLFRDDPRHPSLHFKKVHDRDPIYAARVTLGYRALGLWKTRRSRGSGSGRTLSTIGSLTACSSVAVGQDGALTGAAAGQVLRS